jgi:hypothetical protein
LARDHAEIEKELVRHLGISPEEAGLYLQVVSGTKIDRRMLKDTRKSAVVNSLASKGMLIRAARGNAFIPVHPRFALSNLFRIYDERMAVERKERRLGVDRLTLELIPIYEKSKYTNSPSTKVPKDE